MRDTIIIITVFVLFFMVIKSCKSDSKEQKAIKIVMQQCMQTGDIDGRSPSALYNSAQNKYYNLRAINLDACPNDFKAAFIEYVDNMGALKNVMEIWIRSRSDKAILSTLGKGLVKVWAKDFASLFIDAINSYQEDQELKTRLTTTLQQLNASEERIFRIAKKYKVKMK